MGGQEEACRQLCRLNLDLAADLNLPDWAYIGENATVTEPVYSGIATWEDAQHWVETVVRSAYEAEYERIRPQLIKSSGGGIRLKSLLAVSTVMASVADFKTGRNSRATVELIMKLTGLGERTVQRARKALVLLRVATEVLRGRLRTKIERYASWRVGDKFRGWASVFALHPFRPVDKTRTSASGSIQMAPHPLWGLFKRSSSSLSKLNTRKKAKGPASRSIESDSDRERLEGLRKGRLLAAEWLRSTQTPVWALPLTVKDWASALVEPAAHGWTGNDLNAILTARTFAPKPENPRGFMKWLLKTQDMDFPPHVLDRIAYEQGRAERAQRAAEFEAERARRANAAGPDSPGRRAAMAVVPNFAGARRRREAADRQAAAHARAELCDRQRGITGPEETAK